MRLDTITNKKVRLKGELNPNDEFYTPEYAIEPLMPYIPPSANIWCPFDTEESNFVKMLKLDHYVTYSHISKGQDFFKINPPADTEFIISNPPYSLKAEVFERLFKLGIPFAMLVGVVGLFESKKRFNLFRYNKFELMYFNKRISYLKSYDDQKPLLNPPFSSVYVCQNVLPEIIMFEEIRK